MHGPQNENVYDVHGPSPNCCAVTILEHSTTVCQFPANTLLRKASGKVQI